VVLHNAYKYSILMGSNTTELAGRATLWAWEPIWNPWEAKNISLVSNRDFQVL
jgi:hypothetical protein